jgi:hypothetical protein
MKQVCTSVVHTQLGSFKVIKVIIRYNSYKVIIHLFLHFVQVVQKHPASMGWLQRAFVQVWLWLVRPGGEARHLGEQGRLHGESRSRVEALGHRGHCGRRHGADILRSRMVLFYGGNTPLAHSGEISFTAAILRSFLS